MPIKRKHFGTDGIRGPVGEQGFNPEFVLKLGWAAGCVLSRQDGQKSKVLIGKDTRISGYMFESALEAGLSAAGVDIHLLGPLPTPAIAYLTRTFRAQAGIVISASHNPYYDNGIKIFSSLGTKLPDELELAIEEQLEQPFKTVDSSRLGKAVRVEDARGRYIEFCKNSIPTQLNLKNFKIIIDCAHGATYHVAPHVFDELGASIVEIGVSPDGININADCGATQPEYLRALVLEQRADLGIALDGDGDRVIMVDHKGEILDGDEILFILAKYGPTQNGVVGTVMSNMGLEIAIRELGLGFARTQVGDRYVFEELQRTGWKLGGETSGHIIYTPVSTTGDGIIAALQVLAIMSQLDRSLHELKSGMRKWPQKVLNVKSVDCQTCLSRSEVVQTVQEVETELLGRGRVFLRPSGTEPIVRVMVEGEDSQQVEHLAQRLVQVLERANRLLN